MILGQLLGYSAITYRIDNEPTTIQNLKMLINARHSLGLTTRLITPKLGDHSFLSENTVDRVRKTQEVSLKACSQDVVSR